MSLTDAQRAAYRFLRLRAEDDAEFSGADLEKVAGWKPGSFSTYKTKHLKQYVKLARKGRYVVNPHFLRLTEDDFAEIVGQSRKTVARFRRAVVRNLLRYEFLLPLTNERKLRAALDELFYREPLEQRAREIGRSTLEQILPSRSGETDQDFFRRIADVVGGLLGGYSIGHVDGRFRASPLLGYQEAAQILAARGRYLVDETTAVVRFILPISESRTTHGSAFDLADEAPVDSECVALAARAARKLFIHFFVESVILDIHAEDEIWFLESGPDGERLYVLERDAGTGSATPVGKRSRPKNTGPTTNTITAWLRASGYQDVAAQIEEIEAGWRANQLKTRRNWFEILAGDRKGRPRAVAGKTFPIIASIRIRQGLNPVLDALTRADEKPLPARISP